MGMLWTENMNLFNEGPYAGKRVGEVLRENPDYIVHVYLTEPDHGSITATQYDQAISALDTSEYSTSTWDYDPDEIDYVAHERHRLRHDKQGGYYTLN